MCATMASCATSNTNMAEAPAKKSRSKEYFAESEYGVKASPRVVAEGRAVPKGGGRYMVGKPYEVKGKTYVPKEDTEYNRTGLASWYGSAFHGRLTANGEAYDSAHLSAAHPTFPLPSYARVTNVDTGSSVIVRVNDRGPFHAGRIIDVSSKTADLLDMKRTGTAKVNVQYVGRARMDGHDMPYLMASYIRKGDRLPSFNPEGQIASGVMVASNQPLGDQLQSYGSATPSAATRTAYAGRTPSGSAAKRAGAGQAQDAFAAAAVMPQAAPVPRERAIAPAKAAPAKDATRQVEQRTVASAYPVVPSTPKTQKVQRSQPVQQAQQIQPAPARVQAPAPVRTTETAYAEVPQGKAPRVMFGNMLLEPPKPGQKY